MTEPYIYFVGPVEQLRRLAHFCAEVNSRTTPDNWVRIRHVAFDLGTGDPLPPLDPHLALQAQHLDASLAGVAYLDVWGRPAMRTVLGECSGWGQWWSCNPRLDCPSGPWCRLAAGPHPHPLRPAPKCFGAFYIFGPCQTKGCNWRTDCRLTRRAPEDLPDNPGRWA
jgi:hypothetical protein